MSTNIIFQYADILHVILREFRYNIGATMQKGSYTTIYTAEKYQALADGVTSEIIRVYYYSNVYMCYIRHKLIHCEYDYIHRSYTLGDVVSVKSLRLVNKRCANIITPSMIQYYTGCDIGRTVYTAIIRLNYYFARDIIMEENMIINPMLLMQRYSITVRCVIGKVRANCFLTESDIIALKVIWAIKSLGNGIVLILMTEVNIFCKL